MHLSGLELTVGLRMFASRPAPLAFASSEPGKAGAYALVVTFPNPAGHPSLVLRAEEGWISVRWPGGVPSRHSTWAWETEWPLHGAERIGEGSFARRVPLAPEEEASRIDGVVAWLDAFFGERSAAFAVEDASGGRYGVLARREDVSRAEGGVVRSWLGGWDRGEIAS